MRDTCTPCGGRHVVTVADDFGASSPVNRAVAEAHDRGILTAASIMAAGEAFDEAVLLASRRPQLSVGLHVTLCDGLSVLPPSRIPALVDPNGNFEKSPARAWLNYSGEDVLRQIEMEVEAQIDRLQSSGIDPSHIDCHHHLHMKPSIFRIICRAASRERIRWIRIPCEPFRQVSDIASFSRGAMPFLEWTVFGIAGLVNRRAAAENGLRTAGSTYGLSKTGRIDEECFLRILDRMEKQVNEVFFHPDLSNESGRRELGALISPRVRERISCLGMMVAGYRELAETGPAFSPARGNM